ncbi:hypothetical protein RclHR1_04220007 [Rhizophagus clarus]|uniref:Uncharacterized protein n=1 Tax=Rhizophagus clarus TaxID=94130 RepID=A0A2Z6SAJ6_9GLOM|nr:hypothetical protein RclHR1_04220007 [Rhizophagus clarus]GES96541.1 hypothetical protein GLOIN_2v1478509 [Rhizophagus clarus]
MEDHNFNQLFQMRRQQCHDAIPVIRNCLHHQSHGPIYLNFIDMFYVVEEKSFERCFLREFRQNQLRNGEHEYLKQLFEKRILGPIDLGEKYYVISKEIYDIGSRNQIPHDNNSNDNNSNNNHQRIEQSEENHKIPQLYNQNLEQKNLKDEASSALGDGNNANHDTINPQQFYSLLQQFNELNEKCKTLQICNENFKRQLEDLGSKHQSDLQKLKDHNKSLKKEASEYQSALGDATSFHQGNQDSDTTSKLSKDIGDLHRKLEKFCGLKKGIKIVADQTAIGKLLERYECLIKGSIKENKNLISGVLERYIIETIIEKANDYFNNEENDKDNKEVDEQDDKGLQQTLEAKIVKSTKQLMEMLDLFLTIRTGNDKVSKSTPTKLRQQIYGILGNRGFSNTVLYESNNKEHPFIEELRKEILDFMNFYRKIEDEEKLAEHEGLINDIIRQVVNIFFFRLKVQEPVAEWKWFPKNTEINMLTMNSPLDKDELENLSVDICAFPLIGSNLNSAEDEKMMYPAQIITNNL